MYLPLQQPPKDPIIAIVLKQETKKPEPKLYTIKTGDNLTTISEAQKTTVQRLWAKNPDLTNPDLLEINIQLKIPTSDEQLPDRPFPIQTPVITPQNSPQSVPRGSSSGNLYDAGQCTAYAKDRRPDLPNNLGNANTWGTKAAAQGFTVNNTPSPGAIGVAKGYMHVVYVESVNPDGSVNISEQNYKGPFIVSSRTAPASEFVYIH